MSSGNEINDPGEDAQPGCDLGPVELSVPPDSVTCMEFGDEIEVGANVVPGPHPDLDSTELSVAADSVVGMDLAGLRDEVIVDTDGVVADLAELDANAALRLVADSQAMARQGEAQLLRLAAHWADLHSDEALAANTSALPGTERARAFGGEGTPLVGEFAPAGFAAAAGLPTQAADKLIADALDLRHRFPRIWERICVVRAPVWLCRKIAQKSRFLDMVAAWFVDAAVADYLTSLPPSRLLTLVEAKIIEADPENAAMRARYAEARRFVRTGQSNECGIKTLMVRAEAGDIIVFAAMCDRIAKILAWKGDKNSLDVRRSKAVGILGNPAQALALLAEYQGHHNDETGNDEDGDAGGETETGETETDGTWNGWGESETGETVTDEAVTDEIVIGCGESESETDPTGDSGVDQDEFRWGDEPEWRDKTAFVPEPPAPDPLPDLRFLDETDLHPVDLDHTQPDTTERNPNATPEFEAEPDPDAVPNRDAAPDPDWYPATEPPPDEWHPTGADVPPAEPDPVPPINYTQTLENLLTEHGVKLTDLLPKTVLYLHLDRDTLIHGAGVIRAEGIGPLSPAQLNRWIRGTNLTITPVIDPDNTPAIDAYETSHRLKEALQIISPAEAFPYGTYTGRNVDHDHATPYHDTGPPGQTRLHDLQRLIRYHHRHKTFGGWQARMPEPGTTIWRSPNGWHFITNPAGTHPLGNGHYARTLWHNLINSGAAEQDPTVS